MLFVLLLHAARESSRVNTIKIEAIFFILKISFLFLYFAVQDELAFISIFRQGFAIFMQSPITSPVRRY